MMASECREKYSERVSCPMPLRNRRRLSVSRSVFFRPILLKNRHFRPQGGADLDRHMSRARRQSTTPSLSCGPIRRCSKRRAGRDAGARQWRRTFRGDPGGNVPARTFWSTTIRFDIAAEGRSTAIFFRISYQVKAMWPSRYCSNPLRHDSPFLQVSTKQPTPTVSPVRNLLTAGPFSRRSRRSRRPRNHRKHGAAPFHPGPDVQIRMANAAIVNRQ